MNKIKEQMLKRGLDAQTLAEKLGVSHQAVYGWINKKAKPKPRYILALSKELKMSIEDVIKETYGAKEVYKIK